MTGKRKRRRPVGETIGGIIVGFDQQIFRTTPPVQELIAKAKPVRTVTGQDGGDFQVVFPDDGVPREDVQPGDTPLEDTPPEPARPAEGTADRPTRSHPPDEDDDAGR